VTRARGAAAWLAALGALAGACGGDPAIEPAGAPAAAPHAWTACQASDQAFVRRAFVALLGRPALGQAEVNAAEELVVALREADADAGGAADASGALEPARRLFAEALLDEPAARLRWGDFLMDALRVTRVDLRSMGACYGATSGEPLDGGALAAYVRDHDPGAREPPREGFVLGDLVRSSLELDDLSPLYRAHLFAMLSFPIGGANVAAEELERARRASFGATFEAAFLHRDLGCLGCHNSEFSVTASDDPAVSRFFAVPGLFERALYGASDGAHPASEAATHGPDDLRARSVLRTWGVADGGGQKPWGWTIHCGTFRRDVAVDPLGVDAYFGSVRSTDAEPDRGRRASVWDLEAALHRGVDALAARGLQRGEGGELADPDEAFAYLVAASIAEQVWTEVMGARLTVAHGFPRTAEQRDVLQALAERLAATHFSLRALLLDVLAHPAFNLAMPDAGCGDAPYELPRLFDPWTDAAADPAERANGPGDRVFARSPRALLRGLHDALGWPAPADFPVEDEAALQASIGVFLKDGEPGFRGLDFQGRLVWEAAYGACPRQGDDLVARLARDAAGARGATVGDAALALKDRLVGEPWIDEVAERPALEALLGAPLDARATRALEPGLRALCGALAASPAFLLGGRAPLDARAVPRLTPVEARYRPACERLALRVEARAPYVVTCGDDRVTARRE
jgi:hypothetical protein